MPRVLSVTSQRTAGVLLVAIALGVCLWELPSRAADVDFKSEVHAESLGMLAVAYPQLPVAIPDFQPSTQTLMATLRAAAPIA